MAKPKAGKKPRAKKAPAKKAAVVKDFGDDVRIAISDKELKYLANYADESLNKAGNITSALGQEISTYAKKGLNAPAFRMVLRMIRMGKRDPIKLRAFRDDLERYSDVLDLDKLTATDLFRDKAKPKAARSSKKTEPAADDRQTDIEEHIEQTGGNLEHAEAAGSA